MATETASAPVNGNYAPHHGYGALDPQQSNFAYAPPSNTAIANPPTSTQTPPAGASVQQSDVAKDEVGWYFVEQYYTTLSRSPEKLYLFYNKRSQFVSGEETDKVEVCVGQRAINDRIKELDFQDCKVRVTNVDSQASDSNIVIQVIGEISNKSQPHKKFTQTFILATQTNGYFVLNDIFRYLIEEEDEPEANIQAGDVEPSQVTEPVAESQESDSTARTAEPKTLTSSMEPAAVERDAKVVDQEPEQKVLKEQPSQPEETTVNGSSQDESEGQTEEEAPAAAAQEVSTADMSNSGVENLKPDQPRSPAPSPQETPAKQPTPEPVAAPKPSAPKTWASLAASANKQVATPVTPAGPSPTSQGKPSTSTAKPAAAVSTMPTTTAIPTSNAPQATPSAPAAQRDESPAGGSQGEEWTAVSSSHNRQHSRQVNQQPEPPNNRGYIKNVTSNIVPDDLKAALEEVAEVTYFDVAPEKNCAFVDFRSPEAYQAAVNHGPFTVNGERVYVEKRHFKNSQGFGQRGNFRGNDRGRGGVNQGPPRGGFQNRGGFRGDYRGPSTRGGAAPRGRGAAGTSQAI